MRPYTPAVNDNHVSDALDPIGASLAPGRDRRRWAWATGVLATVLVVVALAGVARVWSRTSDLERQLTVARRDTRAANAAGIALARRVSDMEHTVAALPVGPVPAGDASVGDASARAIARDISDLKDCVNAYMDTIGTWSTDVRSRYTYDRC